MVYFHMAWIFFFISFALSFPFLSIFVLFIFLFSLRFSSFVFCELLIILWKQWRNITSVLPLLWSIDAFWYNGNISALVKKWKYEHAKKLMVKKQKTENHKHFIGFRYRIPVELSSAYFVHSLNIHSLSRMLLVLPRYFHSREQKLDKECLMLKKISIT